MKGTRMLFAPMSWVSLTLAASLSGGFNQYVISCQDKDNPDTCQNISLINGLNTCMEVPDASKAKYGDKGSSFQVYGQMACRLFKTAASLGCKDPIIDPETNLTGGDGQRATGWYTYPGIMDWQEDFKFQSFLCTAMTTGETMEQLPEVVIAECATVKDVKYACRGQIAIPPGGE